MVFNPDGDKLKWLSETVLINPVIVEKSSKTDVMEEGCLSFPGMVGDVRLGWIEKKVHLSSFLTCLLTITRSNH